MTKQYKNEIKNFHRDHSVTKGKVYGRIIDLCGPQMLSPKHLIENRNLLRTADVTFIEKESSSAKIIQSNWKSLLSYEPIVHVGRVETFEPSGEYDWINLDTCSSFSFALGEWLSNLRVKTGGEVNVWLTSYRSNLKTLESLRATFRTGKPYRVLHSLYQNCWHEGNGLLDLVPDEKKQEALLTVAGLAKSMSSYSFDVMPIRTYVQHIHRMYLFRFVNFRPADKSSEKLAEIIVSSEHQSLNYKPKTKAEVGENTQICDLIRMVANGDESHRSYATMRMRRKIEENGLIGKTPKMTKAGWKSHISKIERDVEIRNKCHRLIERI